LLPRWPGVLIVVAGLSVVAWLTGFEADGGRVVGAAAAEQILAFALPRADWGQTTDLLPSAFVLALVSFLEAMSSCKVASARTGQRWDGNQELIGQGLAKLTAAVCQAYPVSGSFGRSAFLLGSGARTGLASVVGALMVLAALLSIPGLIAHIPRPVLAAVILVTVAGLLSPAQLREAWRSSRDDGLAGTVSFVATLAFAPHIEIGILAGLLLSLALLIYRSMKPRVAVLGPPPGRHLARRRPLQPGRRPTRNSPSCASTARCISSTPPPSKTPCWPSAATTPASRCCCCPARASTTSTPAASTPCAASTASWPTAGAAGLLRPQEAGHRRDGAHRPVEPTSAPTRLPHRRRRPAAPVAQLARPCGP
jgi:hypothetical protein